MTLPQDPGTVTLRCLMTGLAPYTRYHYAVQPSAAAHHPAVASFVSPPLAGAQFTDGMYPLRILAFGDVDWTDGHPGDPVGSDPADVGNSHRESSELCCRSPLLTAQQRSRVPVNNRRDGRRLPRCGARPPQGHRHRRPAPTVQRHPGAARRRHLVLR